MGCLFFIVLKILCFGVEGSLVTAGSTILCAR
jgi:hypothetical protein